jgi:hypothetical protein
MTEVAAFAAIGHEIVINFGARLQIGGWIGNWQM